MLEVGCGTGVSTVALAEQGAVVTAVDVSGESIAAAERGCGMHDVEARFVRCNARELGKTFAGSPVEWIVFWASLEHMTLDERLDALAGTPTSKSEGCMAS